MINLILSSVIAFLPTTVAGVAQTDSSTIVLCSCTANGGVPVKLAINRKTQIVTEDGSYKLKHTYQMPIWDEAEARMAYFSTDGQTLNFALEFEKFPLDKPFDLVENGSKAGSLCIRDINGARKTASSGDLHKFLEATPYSEYGIRHNNGHPSEYYDDGEILIRTVMGAVCQIGNKIYQSAKLYINNRSMGSFALSQENIRIYDAESKPIKIMKASKANDLWHEMDRAGEVLENGLNAGQIASGAITSASLRYGRDLSFAGFGLGMIVGGVSDTVAEKKISEQNKARVDAMQYYFRGATITPAEEYYTFFTLKRNKKKDTLSVMIDINGKTYEFIMN